MPLHSLLLVLFLCASAVLAQVAQPLPSYLRHPYRFRHINTEHGGLSQNTVFAALQDRKGFLWIATGDGLNRYDGYTCKVFRHNPNDSTTLPSHQVFCLLEDSDGNLWCGTEREVVRFLPKTGTFEAYIFPNIKPNSATTSAFRLFEDSKKRIWVCTPTGMFVVDKINKRLLLPSTLDSSGKKFDMLPVTFLENAHKRLLLGYNFTNKKGELRAGYAELDQEHDKFIPANLIPGNLDKYELSVYLDSKGISWFHAYTHATDRFTRYRKYNPRTNEVQDNTAFRGDLRISHVYEDSFGNHWFMEQESLRILNLSTNQADTIRYAAGDVQGVAASKFINYRGNSYTTGKHYISTEGGGINLFRPKPKFAHVYRQNKALPNQLSESMLWGMAEDSTGNVWIATIGGGINRFNPSTGEIRAFFTTEIMRSVLCDNDGSIWASDQKFRLIHINNPSSSAPQIETFSLPTSVQFQPIYTMVQDRYGVLWCGIYGNTVVCFNPATRTFTKTYEGLGTYLSTDSKGNIWAGGNGITVFDPANADRICFSGKDSTPQLFTRYLSVAENPNSPSDNDVRFFHEDADGTMWIATIRGLDHFDPVTKRFTHYNEQSGMPNSYVYGILPDDNGNLWVSTNRGLSKFNKTSKIWRNYSPYDGLQSYEFDRSSFVRLRKGGTDGRMKGWMLFGGVNGFNIFHPDSVRDNPDKPPVAITNILINEKPYSDLWRGFQKDSPQHGTAEVSELTALDLAWTDNTLSFEFAALEFTDPEKNQYAYQMEGIDKGWVQSGTLRTARYAGLSPGDYVFRVRACNNDGVWNEVGTSLRVRIVPPFWRTAWFYALLLVGGVGIVVGTTRTISRQRFKRELALTTERLEAAQLLETERLEQELALQRERLEKEIALEKERGRISQDLHDELGPGMTKILLLSSSASTSPDGMNAHEITTTAQEVIHSMAGVIWLTRPENDTVRNLVAYLREYATDYLGKAGIELDIVHPRDLPDTAIEGAVRRSIFLVIKEALNNVVKHSGASTVRLTIEFPSKNRIIACVEDNGHGFLLDSVRRFGNGLRNMQRRMEDNGGTCSIVPNQTSAGTTVRLEAAW